MGMKTPLRPLVGPAFLLLAAIPPFPALAADPVCGPRKTSIELPDAIQQRHDDIPLMGENVTQEARITPRTAPGPSCGRVDYFVREIAFEPSFDELRAEYLGWLETQLTGPHPLASEYVRNHGVKIVDSAGQFRFIDTVKPEPDHHGRLEIHITEESGASGRSCRQVILRYSRLGETICEKPSP